MPDLRKTHESPGEVRFAYPHAGGWIFALVGVAGAASAFTMLEGFDAWLLGGFGVLFGWMGITSGLTRMELALDFGRRRYTYRRGTLPSLESGEGSFDDIEAVVLVKDLDRKRGGEVVDEWEVELVIRGWPRPVEILETKDEDRARREADELARRLGVEVRERTER